MISAQMGSYVDGLGRKYVLYGYLEIWKLQALLINHTATLSGMLSSPLSHPPPRCVPGKQPAQISYHPEPSENPIDAL